MSDLTVAEIAYAAGLMDGEGSVMISRERDRRQTRQVRRWYYVWRVTVNNTDADLLGFLETRWGGSILRLDKYAHPEWKVLGRWEIKGATGARFLTDVLPHLIAKRRQAENALTLHRIHRESRLWAYQHQSLGAHGSLPTKAEFVEAQERLYQAQKILNRRGRAPEVDEAAKAIADEVVAPVLSQQLSWLEAASG